MRYTRYCIGVLLAAVWAAPLVAQGPTGTIRGNVTDQATQRPLQGATISVGSRVTTSRADGEYALTGIPAGTDSLRVRMIGYAPYAQAVTVQAGQALDLDLALTARAVNLAEMVVVGYGEQQAGDITGAVSQVNSDQFNTGRVITPTELIQNKVAGVQVVENNEPGGGTSIRIRGPSSVTASSDPLFVVDGMPLGASGAGGGISAGRDPLNFIDPNDIESITVLRDASAAAIYGANAANGVVLITTKSGKGHTTPVVEYTGSVSAATVTRLPSMLNAAQFRAAVTQYAPGSVNQLGAANTNWFNQVDRTGYGMQHNVAVAGGGESSNYRLSLNYSDENGIMDYTRVRQVNLGLSYNQNLFDNKMTVQTNLRGYREWDRFTPGGVISNAAQMGPTQPVFDPSSPTGYFNWTGGIQSADNPAEILNYARDEGTTYRSVGNVLGTYRLPFLEGLKANLNLGFDATKATRTTFSSGLLHSQIRNTSYGQFYQRNPSQLNSLLDAYLDYAIPRKVGPGALDLTGGYSYFQSHSEYPSIQADSLATNNLGINGIPASKTVTPLLYVNDSKLISLWGRMNYNINDRYLLAATVRRDGSSRFGTNNAWGVFPSVSGAWRLSEESFLRNVNWLSDLKLRASWARTGNQSFGDYLQKETFTVGNNLGQQWLGNGFVTTIRPSGVDPNIKWEATRSVDLGLDYGFKNQRFTGAIDWYDKKTTDMLFYVPAAPGTCVCDYITTNIGSMRNRGIEFSLSADILRGGSRGLSWTADFTASHLSNELLTITPYGGASQTVLTGNIAGGVGSTIQVLTPGQPINSFYVYKQLYQNGKPLEGQYADLNGDGIINANDLRPFHDPAPKWMFGHSSYFTYGHLDFGFTLRAYTGNYVYNNVASNLGSYLELSRGSPYNLHSSVLKTGFTTPQYFSDYYVEKASFLRMDNLSVGYSFNLQGRSAKAFASIQNVFTITGYSGVDPTAGINGIDNNMYPRSRTFTSGLTLRF